MQVSVKTEVPYEINTWRGLEGGGGDADAGGKPSDQKYMLAGDEGKEE